MKKNVLALSIATMIGGLGFVSTASAVAPDLAVSESGVGQILVVPYFTAQAGNTTAFHLTNTDDKFGKAVKVRFRGASNSDDILDFQVFLSPGDVWTASVAQGDDGLAKLSTSDNSCTLPRSIKETGTVKFAKNRLKDGADNAETREGYIEILNMADIDYQKHYVSTTGKKTVAEDAGKVKITAGTAVSALYTATKHATSGATVGTAPCTSTVLDGLKDILPEYNNGLVSGTTTFDAKMTDSSIAEAQGLLKPTGKLAGAWYIINVANSTTYSGAATAINDKAAAANHLNLYSPQMARSVASRTNGLASADPLLVSGLIDLYDYDLPDLSTPTSTGVTNAAEQTQGLTTAISATKVSNDFLQDPALTATTDWVLSMPTRRYMVAANYKAVGTSKTPYAVAGVTATASADTKTVSTFAVPAAGEFAGATAAVDATEKAYRVFNTVAAGTTLFGSKPGATTYNAKNQICAVAKSQVFLDREEQSIVDGPVASPGETPVVNVCGEVSVLTFGGSSVLGSSLTNQALAPEYKYGWGSITFDAAVPVLGAAFQKAVNPAASAGMVGNYGITWPHVKN